MRTTIELSLKQRYTLALSLIALLTIVSQMFIQVTVMKGESDSRIVNIAGRQRMLSQRINKCVLGIYSAENESIRQRYREELTFSFTLWESSHRGLQFGDEKLGLPGENSTTIKSLFANIDAYHQGILGAAKRVAEQSGNAGLLPRMQADIALIRESEKPFLKGMDAIVFQYDKEAKDRVNVIKHIEIGILLVTLLVLALEARFIFVPADRKIREDMSNLRNSEENLRRLFEAKTQLLTEQQELIRKLAEAHNQLLQSEKLASIGQLAAGVAHEINNPIGFVNSNLCTLQLYMTELLSALSAYELHEDEMTAETQAVLTELKRKIDLVYLREDFGSLLAESMDGLQRVKRIVQDLKDFSHVDESEKQSANLEQGLDSTLNVVWNELKYKADIVKEYGGIPEIECLPSQLNQVFMNLLMNAVQAITEHGKITLRTGQEGGNVWVEVEDTGSGIKPEHLEHIFDPFFTTKPIGSGTGLGLSLSYGIVQKHGGRIEVKSEVGKGTVFRVVLPQHAIPLQASAEDKKTVG